MKSTLSGPAAAGFSHAVCGVTKSRPMLKSFGSGFSIVAATARPDQATG